MNNKEKRPSKRNSMKENKKFPYKRGREFKLRYCGRCGEKDTMLVCCECLRELKKQDKTKQNKQNSKEETTKSLVKE